MDKGFLAFLIWLGVCAAITFPCLIFYWIMCVKEKKELAKETIGDKRLQQLNFEIFQEKQDIKELYHLILTFHSLNKDIPKLVQDNYLAALRRYNDRIEKYRETLKEPRYSTIGWEKESFDTAEEIENYVIKNFFK